jgi:hypothetical protein
VTQTETVLDQAQVGRRPVGRPVGRRPVATYGQLNLKLAPELVEEIRRFADANGETVTGLVRRLLVQEIRPA